MKLNLGAGNTDKESGWYRIDIDPSGNPDLLWDLNKYPYPIENNSVTEIRAFHIVEHISNTLSMMGELHRICKPNARIYLKVPYFRHQNAYDEPTHCKFFTERSFTFFDRKQINNYCNITGEFKVIESKLNLNGKIAKRLGLRIISILNLIIPIFIHEVEVELEVVK